MDWGLGHTTRCVPIIRYLQECGHTVLFAGNEAQRNYITATFANINTIHLEGYNVQYASSGLLFMPAIARQLPGLLRTIKQEHNWLAKVVREQGIDAVISDNRYGLYHKDIPCVIMTHQLKVMSGMGSLIDDAVQKMHYKYLNKFDECWIVDTVEIDGLAGKLSHPAVLPEVSSYIGLLSQMQYTEPKTKGYLLVLLSGPEPQRTILADKIWVQLRQYEDKVVFVEGSKDIKIRTDIPSNITYYQQLVKDELIDVLSGADMVICRSGYSTLMDLVRLNKKAILIPTPGQSEQEYLGKYLQEQLMFMSKRQKDFKLLETLTQAKKMAFRTIESSDSFDKYETVLDSWIAKI